jgi:tetratricopeptide (TPR) repeat protein
MTQRHGATESPLEGFESRLQAGFEWLSDRPREVLGTLLALLVAGALGAAGYEWYQRGERSASEDLARADRSYAEAMGGDPWLIDIPEPANVERARSIREDALVLYEEVLAEHSGTRAASFAALRAAEMELDLGMYESAQTRLRALAVDLGDDDVLTGVALRLLAYMHAEAGRYLEAADTYAEAAGVPAYPDSGPVWLAAARNYERVAAWERAADAYDSALAADPAFAEQAGVIERMTSLLDRQREASAAEPLAVELNAEVEVREIPAPEPDVVPGAEAVPVVPEPAADE